VPRPLIFPAIGSTFGRLTVLRPIKGPKRTMVECRCMCGTVKTYQLHDICNGHSTSCGCYSRELIKVRSRNPNWLRNARQAITKHGHARRATQSPEYKSWCSMLARCNNRNNPKFSTYGGRGIKVSPGWVDSFAIFLSDMGLKPTTKHSLGRIDNNRGYEPDNCRWETPQQQATNKTNTIRIPFRDSVLCLKEVAEITGINYYTLWTRYKKATNFA